MIAVDNLDALSQTQLRQTVELLMTELRHKSALVDKLTHEMAVLKRLKYAATSEKFCAGLPAEQKSLLEETLGDRPGAVGSRDRPTAARRPDSGEQAQGSAQA